MRSTDFCEKNTGIGSRIEWYKIRTPLCISHYTLMLGTVKMSDSIVKAQRQNFEQFTMQDLMNPSTFQTKAQAALFQPYMEERLLVDGSTLPDLEVQFSWMDGKKPPQDGKEYYRAILWFKPIETPTRETRMALGEQLLTKLSLWTLLRSHKPRLDLTITNDKGKILLHYANIKLHPPCFKEAMVYHKVNQGIMDSIADTLLRNRSSIDFVMDITMHEE